MYPSDFDILSVGHRIFSIYFTMQYFIFYYAIFYILLCNIFHPYLFYSGKEVFSQSKLAVVKTQHFRTTKQMGRL